MLLAPAELGIVVIRKPRVGLPKGRSDFAVIKITDLEMEYCLLCRRI
jgi:hypothetical protein